jgi:hypothetical protein
VQCHNYAWIVAGCHAANPKPSCTVFLLTSKTLHAFISAWVMELLQHVLMLMLILNIKSQIPNIRMWVIGTEPQLH